MSHNNLSSVIILVGIPGSGKTTFREAFIKKNPEFTYISPDEIREEVTGNISDNSQDSRVWGLVYKRLQEFIHKGVSVIFDATNINPKTRQQIESIAKDNINSFVFYKIFDIPASVAKERIRKDIEKGVNRSNVPDEVIDRMYSKFVQEVATIKKSKNII